MNFFLKGLLTLSLTILSTASFAHDHEVGNGGDAIQVGNTFYSFDLYEGGVQETPYYRRNVKLNQKVLEKIVDAIDPTKFPVDTLAQKLSELYLDDPNFTDYIIETMKSYSWHFVNGPLKDVDDDQDTVINPPTGLTQAAIRHKETITITLDVWNKMDENNKAALTLHEAIYAMVQPLLVPTSKTQTNFKQESAVARRAVAFLFSRDFEPAVKGWNWFLNLESVSRSLIKSASKENTLVLTKDAFYASAGDKFQVSVEIRQNDNPVRSRAVLASALSDMDLENYCDRKDMPNLPDSTQVIRIIPLKAEISGMVPFFNRNTGKLDWANYENLWAFYPGFGRTSGSDHYIIQKDQQSCIANLKNFAAYDFGHAGFPFSQGNMTLTKALGFSKIEFPEVGSNNLPVIYANFTNTPSGLTPESVLHLEFTTKSLANYTTSDVSCQVNGGSLLPLSQTSYNSVTKLIKMDIRWKDLCVGFGGFSNCTLLPDNAQNASFGLGLFRADSDARMSFQIVIRNPESLN